MVPATDIIAYATLVTATLSGVAGIIGAWRTGRVEKRQLVNSTKLDEHDTKLSGVVAAAERTDAKVNDVVAIAAHTAESIDNHIADEKPLIDHQKSQLRQQGQ